MKLNFKINTNEQNTIKPQYNVLNFNRYVKKNSTDLVLNVIDLYFK